MNLGQGIVLALIPTSSGLVPYWAQAALGESIVEDESRYLMVGAKGKVLYAFPKDTVVAILLARGQAYTLYQKLRLK